MLFLVRKSVLFVYCLYSTDRRYLNRVLTSQGISPTNRFGTVIPLTIILIFSALKERMEDSKRSAADKEVNTSRVQVLCGTGGFNDKTWRKVNVGDIVRVENGDFFPADLILLSSSEPEALCYIETANLDGYFIRLIYRETNLKIRQGRMETAHLLTPEAVAAFQGEIKSEMPNNSLYTYEGTLLIEEKEVPLEPLQLLLRGAVLRNTRWVYGVVVFTGHETKLLQNQT
jgi:phospholipid-transporting ATPase